MWGYWPVNSTWRIWTVCTKFCWDFYRQINEYAELQRSNCKSHSGREVKGEKCRMFSFPRDRESCPASCGCVVSPSAEVQHPWDGCTNYNQWCSIYIHEERLHLRQPDTFELDFSTKGSWVLLETGGITAPTKLKLKPDAIPTLHICCCHHFVERNHMNTKSKARPISRNQANCIAYAREESKYNQVMSYSFIIFTILPYWGVAIT